MQFILHSIICVYAKLGIQTSFLFTNWHPQITPPHPRPKFNQITVPYSFHVAPGYWRNSTKDVFNVFKNIDFVLGKTYHYQRTLNQLCLCKFDKITSNMADLFWFVAAACLCSRPNSGTMVEKFKMMFFRH